MPALRQLWLFPLTALLLQAAQSQLELNGQFEEVTTAVHVQLYGVEAPFNASTTSKIYVSSTFDNQ